MSSDTLASVAPVHRFILLTDIVQSSRLAENYGREYLAALQRHNQLVERAAEAHGGTVYKQTGDGYLVLFETAEGCLEATLELGETLGQLEPVIDGEPLLVRLAMHAGSLQPSGQEYFGSALNRASRICQVCNPGQVLCSAAVATTLGKMPAGTVLEDLGQHHLRDLAEPEQLYQLNSECFCRHEFPPLSTLNNRPNNLIEQPNAFIGRESELQELAELLLNGTRLVTITAPGGYGKSRLAAQLCANLLHRFERGCFMVYLAPVREAIDVPFAIGNALGYQFSGGRTPEQQLCDYLRAKELLLCLDNFEHLLDCAPLVAQLLAAAPQLKIIIASREPLRNQGEQVYVLEPLPLEAGSREYSEAELLFADRASLVNRGFTLTPENSPEVRHFCEHMAGIPLAIELAAAWMDSFTLKELHDELTDQLELEARTSDREARHQSLKASLDWSWNLLGGEQQEILMRLSTCRGGFFSEAASAVLNMKGMALRAVLAKLCDKSWLYTREVDGQTRFFMRDMLSQEYAFAKLEGTRGPDDSLFEQAVGAHAAYFSALAERENPRRTGSGTAAGGAVRRQALRTWQLELENISEALDSALRRTEPEWLRPIAAHLYHYYDMTSAFFLIRERYSALHDVAQKLGDPALQLPVCLGLGISCYRRGEVAEALARLNEAQELAKQAGSRNGEASALNILGSMHFSQGDYGRAAELLNQALTISREIGNRYDEASALGNLGSVHTLQGDFAHAAELQSQALMIKREIGDRLGEAYSLNNLGNVHYTQGNYIRAADLHSQALLIFRELGSRWGEAFALINLGGEYYMQGGYARAAKMLNQALAIDREIGHREGEALALTGLGNMHFSQGGYAHAAEKYSQALAITREIKTKTRIAVSCALAGATLAALGCWRAAALALHGAFARIADLGISVDHDDLQLINTGLARLDAAVASGEISAGQLAAWKAEGEALSLDELAEFVQSALDEVSKEASAEDISAEA